MIKNNIPQLKLGIVSVSRDCFPMSLSETRRNKVASYNKKYGDIYECPVCIENEKDMKKALEDINNAGVMHL